MSKCWKCNKEFYGENLSRTLCDECLAKIPQTTATTDFVGVLDTEISSNQRLIIPKPEDMKVNIWGYELCNGAQWIDFLDIVNKLGKEKSDLEAKLAEKER